VKTDCGMAIDIPALWDILRGAMSLMPSNLSLIWPDFGSETQFVEPELLPDRP
jgi:RNAse (barnase) inhibitor barstar